MAGHTDDNRGQGEELAARRVRRHTPEPVKLRAGWQRLPDWMRRFMKARRDDEVKFKACLRCGTGDLTWDILCAEWHCIQCGWFEHETLRRDDDQRSS